MAFTRLHAAAASLAAAAALGSSMGAAAASSGHAAAVPFARPRAVRLSTSFSPGIAPDLRPVPAPPRAVKAPAHAAPASPPPARARTVSVPAPKPKPYTIVDSTTPSAIPPHSHAAVYSNGAYQASPSQVAAPAPHVLKIDSQGTNPRGSDVLDVEPGDAVPAQVPGWVAQELAVHHIARVYTYMSDWGQVKAAVASLPWSMRHRIHWWIADPTGSPHMVPGADATQYYWGPSTDLSVASPGF